MVFSGRIRWSDLSGRAYFSQHARDILGLMVLLNCNIISHTVRCYLQKLTVSRSVHRQEFALPRSSTFAYSRCANSRLMKCRFLEFSSPILNMPIASAFMIPSMHIAFPYHSEIFSMRPQNNWRIAAHVLASKYSLLSEFSWGPVQCTHHCL